MDPDRNVRKVVVSRVSVIIPVYNGERYLPEAIESVLSQTVRPLEIIVVDDGSTDGSARIARQFRSAVLYTYQPNGGAAAARNQGVALARGDQFAFLDADDLWVTNRLERQAAALQQDPMVDMVFGYVEQFRSPELDPEVRRQVPAPADTVPGYHAGTMLVRRDAFLRVGYFDTDRRLGEFIDWFARATEAGLKSLMLPDVVMKRRVHSANLGRHGRDRRQDYVRVLKAALDRRRKAARQRTRV